MRLLHVTDLHHNRRWFDWTAAHASDVDLVCITGDLLDLFPSTDSSLSAQVRYVTDWANAFPGTLALCSGNHDWLPVGDALPDDQAEGKWVQNLRRHGRVFVDGDDVPMARWRIGCRPWIGAMPVVDLDDPMVLLTHAGLAKSRVACGVDGDLGDEELRPIAGRLAPESLVLSGHVHDPILWFDVYGECTCLNPGCGPRNAADPSRIVVDLDHRVAEFVQWTGRRMRARW